jgi:SAM-dependent methyltransferase
MSRSPDQGTELAKLYRVRFEGADADRARVWRVITSRVFQAYVPVEGSVLDVGCGWGEFINAVNAKRRFAMDLNPDARSHLAEGVEFFQQSCANPWPVSDHSLDTVFTSNFLEHLSDKEMIVATVGQAFRCLKPRGRLICLGPNVRFLPGAYWDFFDHHIPLSERSLGECLRSAGFEIERSVPRFLPYTMSGKKPPASFLINTYLSLPIAWPLFGKQFLVIARKP